MNRYEALLDEVYSKGLYVKEKPLQSSDGRIKETGSQSVKILKPPPQKPVS